MTRFLQHISPRGFHWRVRTGEKVIYLTFDDGPTRELTTEILKILSRYHAQATFFCVGQNLEELPDVYSRIISRNHITGNHTYHHLNGWKTGKSAYLSNVSKCDALMGSPFFRPPYGKIKLSQANVLRKHYKIIMWDVLSRDFDRKMSKEDCLHRTIHLTRPGSIVVFHDNIKAADNMLYCLPRYLEYFSKEGYRFEGLKEEMF